jgi:hypothetical protein
MIDIAKKKINENEYKYILEVRNDKKQVTYRDNVTIGGVNQKDGEKLAKFRLLIGLLKNDDLSNVYSLCELIPTYWEK